MEFEYRLTGHGWAEATIAEGGRAATVTVSYLTDDALGDLLSAVSVAFGPLGEGRCSWQEEPGEYEWSFERSGAAVRIRIDWYGEWRELLSDQASTTVFEATVTATEVASVVLAAAETVLGDYGEQGYLDRWGADPFPTARMQRLQAVSAGLNA